MCFVYTCYFSVARNKAQDETRKDFFLGVWSCTACDLHKFGQLVKYSRFKAKTPDPLFLVHVTFSIRQGKHHVAPTSHNIFDELSHLKNHFLFHSSKSSSKSQFFFSG